MTFDQYQQTAYEVRAKRHDLNNDNLTLLHPILCLCQQSGEIAKVMQIALQENSGIIDDQLTLRVGIELGHILYHIAAIAHDLGLNLDLIVDNNVAILTQ